MKELKVGDIRQVRDEVRHLDDSPSRFPCEGMTRKDDYGNELDPPHVVTLGEWEPVQLLGHKILASDLMVAEFRRP